MKLLKSFIENICKENDLKDVILEGYAVIFESEQKSIEWIKPSFEKEEEEFTNHFFDWLKDTVIKDSFDSNNDVDNFLVKIRSEYNDAKVQSLSDDEWSKMQNTDSWVIETEKDLFDTIIPYGRDKKQIINYSMKPIKEGGIVETPIVAYVDGHAPYLVAGNTRLSVCKMLGIRPMVTKVVVK